MGQVLLNSIYEVSNQILQKIGVPDDEAVIVSGSILDAHKKGKHTHGIGRLPIYERKIREGLMNAETVLTPVRDAPAVSVFDANNGFGQVAAYKGILGCIDKAKAYGIGIAAIKSINSFGTAGYYGEIAAKHKMIAMIMGNASPALAPAGGNRAIFGTNPLCFAFPGTEQNNHIVFDMACAVAARSKIRLAAKNGDKIPPDWALDADGKPTDDPVKALDGLLNPIGGYKGFGLAMVVDIMAGLLSGSAFAGGAKALNDPAEPSDCGCFMAAVNPEFFLGREEYENRIDCLIERIKACGKPGDVRLPGESGYLHEEGHPVSVEISDSVIDNVNKLADTLSIARLS